MLRLLMYNPFFTSFIIRDSILMYAINLCKFGLTKKAIENTCLFVCLLRKLNLVHAHVENKLTFLYARLYSMPRASIQYDVTKMFYMTSQKSFEQWV